MLAAVYDTVGDGVVNAARTAATVTDKAITLAKMADMATASIIGRKTAATGVPEVLSAADVRTLLNVADGANAYVHPSTHSADIITDARQTKAYTAAAVEITDCGKR